MEMEPSKGPIRPKRVTRIQTTKSRAAAVGLKASSFETPKLFTKLIACDKRYSKWLHENCLSDLGYNFLRFFELSGDGMFWLSGTTTFWLHPSAGSPDTRMFAVNLFISLIFDLFAVGCIKSIVQRKRPGYNRERLVVVLMDQWSFPSGHSTRAVMIVTLIWLYTPMWRAMLNQYWWPNLVLRYEKSHYMSEYVLPCVEHYLMTIANYMFVFWVLVTTCSRVLLGRHYILDVIGGMSIGILEAFVAHFCLHVPRKVSELQHAYLLARFGMYEDLFWRLFHGRWSFTDYHYREINREIIDDDEAAHEVNFY